MDLLETYVDKRKVKEVELDLEYIYSQIGIDRPHNHQFILQFVAEDVDECADPKDWHSGDVAIAFRRWIEAQADEQP